MDEFFDKLLSPDGFVPRWTCGSWTPFHGYLAIGSNLLIFAAYMMIPLAIRHIIRRRAKDRQTPKPLPFVGKLFCAFIFWCGMTHLLDATLFYHPVYRLDTLVRAICAAVSAFTVVALIPLIPKILAMPTAEEYEAKIAALEKAEKEARHNMRDLQQLLYRSVLEKELQVMRDLQAARNYAEVQKSVEKLDAICSELRGMMPAQYQRVDVAHQRQADGSPDLPEG